MQKVLKQQVLQARHPSCHPTNSVKALKDDNVLSIAFCHQAAKIRQEHCDGCMGCLARHPSCVNNSVPGWLIDSLLPPSCTGGQISIQISISKSPIFKLQISNLAKQIPILNPAKANQVKSPKLKSQIKSKILFYSAQKINQMKKADI